jgi:ribosomal protein L27
MAKDINKYAQNIARARYATPSYRAPQRRATIDPTLFSGKKAAAGAPLASRPIEGGPALPSPQEYNPIIDAESGEDPNAPRVETQQPIENRGSSARYMLQTGGPRLDLSFLVPERVNPAFDPNKAIGGENVPYQESTGVGGFFRRLLGDESNRMNIEAQQAQGAEWRAEAKAEKERQAKKEDLADEIRLRMEADRTLKKEDREFTAEQNKAMREFTAAQNAADRTLRQGESQADRDTRVALAEKEMNSAWRRLGAELDFRKGESAADRAFRSSEGAADRAARMAESEANRSLTAAHYGLIREDNAADRALRSSEGAANRAIEEARLGLQREGQAGENAYRQGEIQYRQRPRFERLGDNVYQNERGDVFEYSPGMIDFKTGKSAPGGFKKIPTQPIPKSVMGGGGGAAQVDRATGLPIGGGVLRPGGSAAAMTPENTALIPSIGRALGGTASEAVTTVSDPLRAAGTEIYKKLFSSQAQQDPEVIARMKRREEQSRNANPPRFQNIPMGF